MSFKLLKRALTIAVLALSIPIAQASEMVVFPSAPVPPSAFKIKQAKAKGIKLSSKPGIDLTGFLFRPKSAIPRPAIITLVSGDGLQNSHIQWGETLASWGYVNLLVDSFGSRGGTNRQDTPTANTVTDAYNAHRFLQKQKYVNPEQIALLGFSLGGSSVFSILNKSNVTRPDDLSFKAGVALYPNCDTGIELLAPVLIMIGDNDPLTSYHSCKTVASEANEWGNEISFRLYPGVTHFFDNPNYSKIEGERNQNTPLPLWFEKNHYNPEAHMDSLDRAKSFFDQHLR